MGDDGGERLAPVIPLFGAASGPRDEADAGAVPEPRYRDPSDAPSHPVHHRVGADRFDVLDRAGESEVLDDAEDPEDVRRAAEEVLVRRLRAKALSMREARHVLRESGLDAESAEDVLDDFSARGYLDDRTLADLLISSGVERKGQGRIVLSRTLAQRGIPREIVAEALEELPDDDAERALEYARSKAPGMSRLEPETALRRMLGQLARRGYGGSVAMSAARTALRETGRSDRGGVRFTESE